ncbi:hypothetical protein FG05_13921 [Fusarium graminearum]|nr:hypothetical protein FG05_13921 [Fusarium graminearum]
MSLQLQSTYLSVLLDIPSATESGYDIGQHLAYKSNSTLAAFRPPFGAPLTKGLTRGKGQENGQTGPNQRGRFVTGVPEAFDEETMAPVKVGRVASPWSGQDSNEILRE